MLGVREAVLVREAVYELIIFLISSCLKWVRRPFFFRGWALPCPPQIEMYLLSEMCLCEVLLHSSNPACVNHSFGRGMGSRLAHKPLIKIGDPSGLLSG